MIIKERLQELIDQKATIYSTTYNIPIKLKKGMLSEDGICEDYGDWVLRVDFKDLYETEEDAGWENEFGNITRTETLRLPSWEEMESKEESIICKFLAKDLYWYAIMQFNGKQGWVVYNINKNKIVGKFLKRTKEDYTKSCRLCKKLFLGENIHEDTKDI